MLTQTLEEVALRIYLKTCSLGECRGGKAPFAEGSGGEGFEIITNTRGSNNLGHIDKADVSDVGGIS